MRIGDLTKRIDLEAPTKASDGMGSYDETWTTIATSVAAAIWSYSGKEMVQSMQTTGEVTHRIRIRYRSVLRTSWRVKFGNRYFSIVSPPIDFDMEHKYLELLCKENV
jgi:SPP1 family predicted phage head-tail adaptor